MAGKSSIFIIELISAEGDKMRCIPAFCVTLLLLSCGLMVFDTSRADSYEQSFRAMADPAWTSARAYNIEPAWYETEVLRMINENRSGLTPMTLNASITWVARDFSKYMVDTGFTGHIVPPGNPPPYAGTNMKDRMQGVSTYSGGQFGGYSGTVWAENIASAGSIDPYYDMERWMASPGHRANIVDPTIIEVGLGAYNQSGTVRSTQDFAGGKTRNIDLSVDSADISFDPQYPQPGDQVTVTALVKNIGGYDAFPVGIKFYDGDPDLGGTQIGSTLNLPVIFINNDTIAASIVYDTTGKPADTYYIFAVVESAYPSEDSNAANNKAGGIFELGMQVPELGHAVIPLFGFTLVAVAVSGFHILRKKTGK